MSATISHPQWINFQQRMLRNSFVNNDVFTVDHVVLSKICSSDTKPRYHLSTQIHDLYSIFVLTSPDHLVFPFRTRAHWPCYQKCMRDVRGRMSAELLSNMESVPVHQLLSWRKEVCAQQCHLGGRRGDLYKWQLPSKLLSLLWRW